MAVNQELLRRISARPDVFGGKPIVRDLRISVELVLSLLAQGVAAEDLLVAPVNGELHCRGAKWG